MTQRADKLVSNIDYSGAADRTSCHPGATPRDDYSTSRRPINTSITQKAERFDTPARPARDQRYNAGYFFALNPFQQRSTRLASARHTRARNRAASITAAAPRQWAQASRAAHVGTAATVFTLRHPTPSERLTNRGSAAPRANSLQSYAAWSRMSRCFHAPERSIWECAHVIAPRDSQQDCKPVHIYYGAACST